MGSAGYIIILICIAIAGAIGGWRLGLSRQCGSLLGMAFGIGGVRLLLPDVAPTVEGWIGNLGDLPCPEYTVASVGALVIYVGFYLLFLVCGLVLNKLMNTIAVRPFDAIAGCVFGFLKWVFAVSIVYNAILSVNQSGALQSLTRCGDGNPVELVMDLSPWVLGTPSPDAMHHRMQLIEAKAISKAENNRGRRVVSDIETEERSGNLSGGRKYDKILIPTC